MSVANIGISSDDIKDKENSGKIKVKKKDKSKKKSKNNVDFTTKNTKVFSNNSVVVGNTKVSGGSSIVIGSNGKVTINNKTIKDGQVIINGIVLSDELIKDGNIKNIKVKNNRAWINGREIDLKTGRFKETKKLSQEKVGNSKVKNNKEWSNKKETDLKTNGFKGTKKLSEEDIKKLRNFFGEDWEKIEPNKSLLSFSENPQDLDNSNLYSAEVKMSFSSSEVKSFFDKSVDVILYVPKKVGTGTIYLVRQIVRLFP